MPRCLVTGGAGFIGSHLAAALARAEYQVRVLDNLSTSRTHGLSRLASDIELIPGDVADLAVARQAVRGVDYIFHLADPGPTLGMGPEGLAAHAASATGTLNLLTAAREAGVCRFVYAGSPSVYGRFRPDPVRETEPPQPLSAYAVAKFAGERYCVAFSHTYGLPTVRLRYFNVFGPGQRSDSPYARVVAILVDAALTGTSAVLDDDGREPWELTYIDDATQAALLAIEAPRVAGKVYNIAGGCVATAAEVAAKLSQLLQTTLRAKPGARGGQDFRHNRANVSLAQTDLGFCPSTDLEAGLRNCLEWHQTVLTVAKPQSAPLGLHQAGGIAIS